MRAGQSLHQVQRILLCLVGAVDREVDPAMLGEVGQRHAERLYLETAGPRS